MAEPSPDEALLIEKAQRSLRAASRLSADGDHDFATSRAYYGVFYALQAALVYKGFHSSKHGTAIAEFNRVFIKEGVFPKEFGKLINQLLQRRQIGDYQITARISGTTAQADIEAAQEIVDAIGKHLAAEGRIPRT